MEPTSRQRELISEMEQCIVDRFDGDTKAEASMFIDEHLEEYRMKERDDG